MKEFVIETKTDMHLVGVLHITNSQLDIICDKGIEFAINNVAKQLNMELRVKCSNGDVTPINPFNADESIKVFITPNMMIVKFLKEEVEVSVIEK